LKYDSQILGQLGINVAPIDNTMLLSYCDARRACTGSRHGHAVRTVSESHTDPDKTFA